MSATFWCHAAPRHEVRTPCDSPDCTPEGRCGYCQDGVEVEDISESPEFNLSEGHTSALVRVLGLEHEGCCGQVDAPDIPDVRRRILATLNQASRRTPHLRESADYRSPVQTEVVHEGNLARIEQRGGCRVIECGLDDEDLCLRLGLFDKLLAYAQEHGYDVSWG